MTGRLPVSLRTEGAMAIFDGVKAYFALVDGPAVSFWSRGVSVRSHSMRSPERNDTELNNQASR